VPDGVSVFAARMFIPPATTPEAFIEMDRNEGRMAIRQLSSVHPDVVAYGCTASSIVQGLAYDAHLRAEIAETYRVPATTAAHAILTAARTLGAATVSIVSPYTEEVDAAEHRYFEGAGLKVLGGAHLGIADGFRLAEPEPGTLFDLGKKGFDPRADALIISCLNTRSHTVIAALEQAIGKPVISSTQATLWHALRLAGIEDRIAGFGKLLQAHEDERHGWTACCRDRGELGDRPCHCAGLFQGRPCAAAGRPPHEAVGRPAGRAHGLCRGRRRRLHRARNGDPRRRAEIRQDRLVNNAGR
jgi:maleate isomerase